MPNKATVEFRKLADRDIYQLEEFFLEVKRDQLDEFFHPHQFNKATAKHISEYSGEDFYCAAWRGSTIVGYGMLRGWDEGYKTPTLGVVVSNNQQGKGLGQLLTEFLIKQARLMGAKSIRLKVYTKNTPAHRLYKKLGFKFEPFGPGEQLGHILLE